MAQAVVGQTLEWLAKNNSTGDKKDPTAGKHRSSGSTSFSAIVTTLVPTVITAVFFIVCFLYLRPRYRNIYAPRTYFRTIPDKDRTPSTRPDGHKWYHDFLWMDDKFLLRHHSLEGYLFLRFFRVIILLCFVGCCLTWPILFPVNVTGGGGAKQLDVISFSNATGKNRLYAHAIVAWLFVGFVLLVVTRERMFLVGIKQAYLTSKHNAQRLSSRTVLFLAAPPSALKKDNLKRYFGPNAERSWVVPKVSDLQDLVDDRNDRITTLETAEVTLAKNVNSKHHKSRTNNAQQIDQEAQVPDSSVRPKNRKIPLVGQQVDTIDIQLDKLPELIEEINTKRSMIVGGEQHHHCAIFVEFKDQLSAYQAYQVVQHHSPLALQPRYIGVQPKEVLWKSLALSTSTKILYGYLLIALFVATILLWSIPVGLVASLSNIQSLTDKVKFLRFINNLPQPVLGFIEGFLPSFALSYLVSEVPFFFRYISKLAGATTTVEAEKQVQRWYFAFQLIQLFLVTTFSSGAAAVATKIVEQPKIIPKLLADNLPKASNFYLSYFILQGIASSAQNIINYSDVASYIFYDKIMDKTPRQKYERLAFMRGMSWGSVYPKFANLTVIAIAYSCIAPLVLGFATIGFSLFYISYRYNLFYTKQVKIETKGDAYGLALQHLMVGVYLLELCLLGLLSARKAEGPSVLVVILLGLTILYHITTNKYLTPLEKFMPVDVLSTDGEESSDGEISNSRSSRLFHSISDISLPPILLDPLATFLEPRFFPSLDSLRPWLSDDRNGDAEVLKYTDDEITNAYMHPALVSKPPKVWLVKDPHDISKWEIEKNEAAGITSTDEGAELDEHNHIKWNKDDFSAAPIFKAAKQY